MVLSAFVGNFIFNFSLILLFNYCFEMVSYFTKVI